MSESTPQGAGQFRYWTPGDLDQAQVVWVDPESAGTPIPRRFVLRLSQVSGRCPFVEAVQRGDLDDARRLAVNDGDECEPAVFDKLVEWARMWKPGTVQLLFGGSRGGGRATLQEAVQAFHGEVKIT